MMIQSVADKDSFETSILELGLDLGTINDIGSFAKCVEEVLVSDTLP